MQLHKASPSKRDLHYKHKFMFKIDNIANIKELIVTIKDPIVKINVNESIILTNELIIFCRLRLVEVMC